MPPKAILAGILLVGFLATLPFWLMGTPEQKQRLAQTTTVLNIVETHVGILDMQPAEQAHLRQMFQPPKKDAVNNFEKAVWQKDIQQVIKPWVPDPVEAQTLARWVYIYSQRFDLSPELILSVIAVESQFDHFAISNAGARGLMQVMPFWKDKLGSEEDNLFEIETNIRYGCAILRVYKDRYGTLARALAAYNGSLGNTKYPARIYAQMKRFKASAADL
ncbi:MAG: transglycosylase SLT domain-containing protein [Mariprofundaceae bacterium]|nr:transglycosylase SLT domain-containing protein [Mariprofundaceae bacterium]